MLIPTRRESCSKFSLAPYTTKLRRVRGCRVQEAELQQLLKNGGFFDRDLQKETSGPIDRKPVQRAWHIDVKVEPPRNELDETSKPFGLSLRDGGFALPFWPAEF
jgi:hypothetical protein